MQHHKLSFRNQSVPDQILLCERAVANVAKLPAEQRMQVDIVGATNAVAAARASHDHIATLRVELRTEIARRKSLLVVARLAAQRATGMVAINVSFNPQAMVNAGLELERPKRPIGKPDAPGNLRAAPHDLDGAVKLRWERPVRRCVFDIEMRPDGTGEDAWRRCDPCTRQTKVVKELESGVKYWFRVRAINAHDTGPWSNVVSARVK